MFVQSMTAGDVVRLLGGTRLRGSFRGASVASGSSIGSASRARCVEEGSAGYGVGGRDGHPGRDTSSCYCSRDDNNSSGSFRYGRAGHPSDRHSAHNASANAYCRDDAGGSTDHKSRDAQHRQRGSPVRVGGRVVPSSARRAPHRHTAGV
jgi:hypothetical protein